MGKLFDAFKRLGMRAHCRTAIRNHSACVHRVRGVLPRTWRLELLEERTLLSMAGQLVGVTAPDSIAIGQTLPLTVTVKNTGTEDWVSWGFSPNTRPSWLVDIMDLSWDPDPPGSHIDRYSNTYDTVPPGETASISTDLAFSELPSSVGINYSFDVYAAPLDYDRTILFSAVAGNPHTVTFSVTSETTPPTVTTVTSTAAANSWYLAGESIPIAITWSEPVTVTGVPQLALNAGTSAVANYSGGSGTTTLTFTYVVEAGQNSSQLDYTSTAALDLNGGTIQDLSGNSGTLTLPAPNTSGLALTNLVVDTTSRVLVVTTETDVVDPNDGLTSLREAIAYANSHPRADTITFAPALTGRTITLTGGKLELSDTTGTTTITGLGDDQLTIDGNHSSQAFYISDRVSADISGLTLANGYAGNGSGGAIWNQGSLSITDCTISGNSASLWGGGIINYMGSMIITNCTISGNSAPSGGGIDNDATLVIRNCTISGNTATNSGGAIYNSSSSNLTIINSTLYGNSVATGGGGGIYNDSHGTLELYDSTIVGNSAGALGGGIYQDTWSPSGRFSLTNSIVASNLYIGSPSDISGPLTANSSLIGNSAEATVIGGDGKNILDADPLLGVLDNYGGPTQTIPLLPDSPAINAGDNTLVPSDVATDQRGFYRILRGIVDIGAFESPGQWQNPVTPVDVLRDQSITALDVLIVINQINAYGPGDLPRPGAPPDIPPYVDVNGDDQLLPLDALIVINDINSLGPRACEGEGESTQLANVTGSLGNSTRIDAFDALPALPAGESASPSDDSKSGGFSLMTPSYAAKSDMKVKQVQLRTVATSHAHHEVAVAELDLGFLEIDAILPDIAEEISGVWHSAGTTV